MNHNISFNAASLIKGLNTELNAVLGFAIELTAKAIQGEWQGRIYRTPGLYQALKDRYAGSVNYTVDKHNLTARIYSDDPMSTPIETGIPARDMKRMLDTSLKTRVVKNGPHAGQRYMIIPFRHNTPGNTAHAQAMPQSIYNEASQLAKSKVTGQISMRSGLNASDVKTKGPLMVMRNTYNWGGRLNGPDIPKRFKGMVRFDTSTANKNDSSFLTFRVMTEWSNGWIVPAQPGRYIVKAVSEQAQQMLKEQVTAAIASVS